MRFAHTLNTDQPWVIIVVIKKIFGQGAIFLTTGFLGKWLSTRVSLSKTAISLRGKINLECHLPAVLAVFGLNRLYFCFRTSLFILEKVFYCCNSFTRPIKYFNSIFLGSARAHVINCVYS